MTTRLASAQSDEYAPGKRFYAVLVSFAATLVVFGFYVASGHEWDERASASVWLWMAGLLVGGLIGPYVLQYAVLRYLGTRPLRKGLWDNRGGSPQLVTWWRPETRSFSRAQFVLVYGAPALFVCGWALLYVLRFPTAAPILGFVVPVYLGNLWYTLLVLKKPENSTVEPFERGVRFHKPVV